MSMLGVQHHFLKLPNITESRNSYHKDEVKLLFDHDELDMNECIADQDMEDEDMVDVIID